MLTKKQLEIILSQLNEPLQPKSSLEQYTIPSSLAAEILNLAYLAGDIKGKTVFDFGTGSGRLAIGAALLRAKAVAGIDIDRSVLKIARKNLKLVKAISTRSKIPLSPVKFVCKDVEKFSKHCDTVIQNPPFGIQTTHADRLFLKKALECGKKIYSLHRGGYKKTRQFLTKFIKNSGGKVLQIKEFKFTLPYTFKFHRKPKVSYKVDLYIIAR